VSASETCGSVADRVSKKSFGRLLYISIYYWSTFYTLFEDNFIHCFCSFHCCYCIVARVLGRAMQQQQQQHSLLSQASWGRLEMKPKKDEKTGRHIKGQKEHKTKRGHGSGTLIANLQALLFIAKSLGIFHSLRSLLTDSSQVSLGRQLAI
jgi:hypothetical protein